MRGRLRRAVGELNRRRLVRRTAGHRLLRAFAAAYPEAVFVEVGANDGEQHDHLRSHIRSNAWRGVMVEPVPYVFSRLQANYGDLDRISLENAAIAERDGRLAFYHLPEVSDPESEGLPSWYDAIGSFSREAVLAHLPAESRHAERIVETEVSCMTFASLCQKHGFGELDLIAIDTEGYDAEVLAQIDLDALRPRLVIYEHYHLPRDVRNRCRERVEAAGYETLGEHFETFCLASRGDALSAAFRRLEPLFPAVAAEDER